MNVFIAVRKAVQAVVMVLFVVVILYIALRLMPGNPAALFIHSLRHPNPTTIAAIYKKYGINPNNKFALSAFIIYFKDMFTFHFGYSFTNFSDPVISLINNALPYTLIIFGVAAVGSFILGIPLGIVTAFIRGKKAEHPILAAATILNSIPFFAMAIVFYLLFIVIFPYFPTTVAHFRLAALFAHPTIHNFMLMIHYFALPILVIMAIEVMGHLLTMRSIMVSTLGEDYIKTAEAKGVSKSGIMFHHAARNAMVPESTRMALEFAFLMSGAVVTEIIFGVPGMGRLIYTNTLDENYPVIQAALFILAIVVIITYESVDFIHMWLDPRVRV
jgi:peptide/nickel transport system permease protein